MTTHEHDHDRAKANANALRHGWRSLLSGALLVTLAVSGPSVSLLAQGSAVTGFATTVAAIDSWEETLAEIQVQVAVDRQFDAAVAALDELLVEVLGGAGIAEQVETLADIAVIRAGLLVEQGQLATAAESLQSPPGHSAHAGDPEQAAQLWSAVCSRPEVMAMAERLAQLIEASSNAPAQDIAVAVAEALKAGDGELITDLGSRAVPALVAQIDPQRVELIQWNKEPLTWLARIDPQRFLSEGRRLMESGDMAEPDRLVDPLLRLMREAGRELWISSEGRRPRLHAQDLVALLAALMGRTEAWDTASGAYRSLATILGDLAQVDGYPPEVVSALIGSILPLPASDVDSLLDMLISFRAPRTSLLAFYEALLSHTAATVRAQVAAVLADCAGSTALRAHVADVEPRVRAALARSLGRREAPVVTWGDGLSVGHVTRTLYPARDAEVRTLLGRLALDSAAAVRLAAARSILSSPGEQPLPDAVYRSLSRDTDERIRTLMVTLVHPDPQLLAELINILSRDSDPLVRIAVAERTDLPATLRASVLTRLCADADSVVREKATAALCAAPDVPVAESLFETLSRDVDPLVRAQLASVVREDIEAQMRLLQTLATTGESVVLRALDQRLDVDLGQDEAYMAAPDAYAALMEQRLSHPTQPITLVSQPLGLVDMETRLCLVPEVLRRVTRWALSRGGEDEWYMIDRLMKPQKPFSRNSNRELILAGWLGLAEGELADLLDGLERRGSNGFDGLLSALVGQGEVYVELLQLLWDDAPHSNATRWTAARGLLHLPGTLTAMRAELIDRDWTVNPQSDEEWEALSEFVKALPEDERAPFVLALAEASSVPDELLSRLTRRFDVFTGELMVTTILARFDGNTQVGCVADAISALARFPQLIDHEWLAWQTASPYWFQALEVMGKLRKPEYLPVLKERLSDYEAVGARWGFNPPAMRQRVIEVLIGYLSNDAAEILLEAAAATMETDDRKRYMAAVEDIQAFQEARLAWERRLDDDSRRDDTVRELAAMLDDASSVVRVEALRALATLAAVDHMPAIIRLLKADDAAVAEAARAALDTLNRRSLTVDEER